MLKIKRFDPLKFARTEKPKEASKFKVPPHITSTKGQQKKQKFLNKFLRKEQTANKSPLERGETIPRGRIRHWSVVGEPPVVFYSQGLSIVLAERL